MINIQAYAELLVEKHQVPAISMAIWQDGHLYQGAAGILNTETGVQATVDSVFQIGSIGKVFTACLIMQLVDEGRINLDQPVKTYLRDFNVACSDATRTITVRQLLCHTSGMAGAFAPKDSNNQGNPIERYLDRCYLLPQAHPPGERFSYANSAYCIAGRLVEVVSGLSWGEAVTERIIKPLGMKKVAVSPLEIPRFRAAIGHVRSSQAKDQWIPVSECYLPLSMAPAGGVLAMTAAELIRFAQAHTGDGQTESGIQWLSKKAIQEMQASQIKLPSYSEQFTTDWGLGWFLINGAETPVFGHDGVTIGQSALLRVVPEKNLIFSILVNGGDWLGATFLTAVFCDLMRDLADIDYEEPKAIPMPRNPERYCGHYESFGWQWDIELEQQELLANITIKSLGASAATLCLKPIDKNSFVGYSKEGERLLNVTFLSPDKNGCPDYLFSCYDLCSRV
jgi:CubicO group peptidase (beta-lactamase class C family)